MSAKPGSVPRWADVAGLISVPPAGKLNVGYINGERPPAGYENWLRNLTYQWLQYLSDGNLTGAHTFGSTVGITGLLTAAAITASGLITANAGVTAGANQNVAVSGTGRFKFGTMTLKISCMAVKCTTTGGIGTATYGGVFYRQDSGGLQADCPIDLPIGARLLAVRAGVKDHATGPDRVTMQVWKSDDAQGVTALGSLQTTSGVAGTNQVLTVTGLTLGVAAANSYFIRFGHTAAAQIVYVNYIEADYDYP